MYCFYFVRGIALAILIILALSTLSASSFEAAAMANAPAAAWHAMGAAYLRYALFSASCEYLSP